MEKDRAPFQVLVFPYRWVRYDEALTLLKWDSNKNALWELDYRLRNPGIREAKPRKEI